INILTSCKIASCEKLYHVPSGLDVFDGFPARVSGSATQYLYRRPKSLTHDRSGSKTGTSRVNKPGYQVGDRIAKGSCSIGSGKFWSSPVGGCKDKERKQKNASVVQDRVELRAEAVPMDPGALQVIFFVAELTFSDGKRWTA